MAAHARLGPSDSARWLQCPGSINFTKHYPNESTDAADEGSAAHWVREQCLNFGFDAYDFIGMTVTFNGKKWVVDDDMADALQPGIDQILEYSGKMFVEERLDLGRWMPGQFGTLDCGIAGEELIVISDLKYGSGVPVQAVKNTQQMIYALGFWDQFARHITDAKQFLIIIDQPRNAGGGGEWLVTLDELLEFGKTLKIKAAATLEDGAPLLPSEKACLWCPAANIPGRAGGCPAHAEWLAGKIDMDFEALDNCALLGIPWQPPIVSALTPERLIEISLAKSSIEKWLEYCHAQALQHLMNHGPLGGYKAVSGRRPPRKWRDTGAAEAFMRQMLPSKSPFNPKLKTPAQAEKEVSKTYEIPTAFVERGQAKPTMVPVEDARPALWTVEDEFDEV